MTCWLALALAAPADLDTTFDNDGKVTTDFGSGNDRAYAAAIQSDGKLVAAGYATSGQGVGFALVRYNPDGSLDTSFDTDGKVTTAFPQNSGNAFAIAIQPDGKIIAAGVAAGAFTDFALARYNADGSLDTTFDTDGKVTTDFNITTDQAQAVAIQPDGKIIVAGYTGSGQSLDFALARYNADGSLDTTFDTDGKVTTDFGSSTDLAQAIAIQPDGKVVAVGYTAIGATVNFAVARYNPDGSLDTSFDTDGKVATDFSNDIDQAHAVAIQSDGKIVVAGHATPATGNQLFDFGVARYNPDGSLDTTFDTDGKVMTDFGFNDVAQAIAIQPGDKIVIVGYTSSIGSSQDFALARYNADGSLDTAFDSDGKVITSFTNSYDIAPAVALQPDGKIVAAGYAFVNSSNEDFAVARYVGDPKPNETANFDTDRRTDISVWNPSNGNWIGIRSFDNSLTFRNWGSGAAGDKPVPGDYDGDGRTDTAVFRPSEGNWYVVRSSDGTALVRGWGNSSDTAVPGDYDLDGKTDVAVFRPSENNWYILNSRDNTVTLKGWGTSGDVPVPADYDGDGATDLAVFRPAENNWYIITSKDRFTRVVNWGASGDKLVPADYDGDGRVDVAVFRPTEGNWYIRAWTNTVTVRGWGDSLDIAVPADYDGDGRTDIAVFRPAEANWYIIESSTNTSRLANLGQSGVVPVPSAYLPQ